MEKRKIFYGWWVVFGGMLTLATTSTLVNTTNSLYVIPISTEFGISRSTYLVTSTITAVAAIFAAPISGRFMNRGNMKKIQIIATVIMALAYSSFAIASKVWHMYLASLMIGIVYMSIAMLPISVMIANWFEKKQGLAMSIVLAGLGIGGAVISPLTTWLILNFGWRMSRVYLSGLILVGNLLPIVFILKPSPEEMGLEPYGLGGEGETKKVNSSIENDIGINIPMEAAKKKSFYYFLMLGMVVSGIICNGGMQHLGAFVTDLHDPIFASMIISLYSFSAIFGKLLLGWIHDKFGNNASVLFGTGMFGISFLLMTFLGSNKTALLISAIIFGTGNSIGSVNANLVTYSVFGRKYYSKILSMSKSMQQIGMALGPVIVGLLYDKSGSYNLAWILSFIGATIIAYSWTSAYSKSRI